MSTCGECGASGQSGPQCGQCGAFLDGDGGLDLDIASAPVVRSHQGATVELAEVDEAKASAGAGRPPAANLELASPPPPRANPGSFDQRMRDERTEFWRFTRFPIVALLAWFTFSSVALGSTWVFVDNVNLLLHEGGHWVFRPFGTTIYFLGGTLMQLLFPAAFASYFWFARRDRFAALAATWWFGENLFGTARYMADAPFENLPLVGGDIHDWNFLFTRWNLISSAQEIGQATRIIGVVITTACLLLMARIAWKPTEQEVRSTDAPDP